MRKFSFETVSLYMNLIRSKEEMVGIILTSTKKPFFIFCSTAYYDFVVIYIPIINARNQIHT